MQTNGHSRSHIKALASLNKDKRRLLLWILIVASVLLVVVFIWHHKVKLAEAEALAMRNRPLVVVDSARVSNVPVYLSALGTVTSPSKVTIRTQVNGILLRILYREGQDVKAGDLIAEIDPRPFLAQLTQFEGQLARDQAQLENAHIDLARYQKLYPQGAVSQQVYDTQVALVNQLEGTVKFDQGQIETVKVNLIYTKITSPIDGRVGLKLIDPGNFVQTSDTNGIVFINTIQPISVVFAIAEDYVPRIMQQIKTGKSLLIKAYDRTQNDLLATGTLWAIDNQINTSTGTVNLKARFSNKDYKLFPNQFVNVKLLLDTLHNAVVVPTTAIQRGPQGTFVYLLHKNHTVSVGAVTTGVTFEQNTVVTSGVLPGQFVVVEGSDALKDGAKVNISKKKHHSTSATHPHHVVPPKAIPMQTNVSSAGAQKKNQAKTELFTSQTLTSTSEKMCLDPSFYKKDSTS